MAVRAASGPARFAVRRPKRAVLIVLASAAIASVGIAAGLFVWWYAHLRHARDAVGRWHNADAFRHLTAARGLRPGHAETLILSARLARRLGEWDEADAILDRYAEAHGEDDDWAFERLLHRAARGETDAARGSLRARIAEGGGAARLVREAVVSGLTDRYRLGEALQVLSDWLGEAPDDTTALFLSGRITELLNGQEEATQTYQRIVALDPEFLDARVRLAAIAVDRRRGEDAAEQLEFLRGRIPENHEVRVRWAQTLRLLGRTADARREFDALLRVYPNDPRILVECGGLALLADDGAARAEELLGRAVQYDPANVHARNQYALALGQNGKADAAAEQYKRIVQLQADSERFRELLNGPLRKEPVPPGVYHELGMLALRGGQARDATRWFDRALAADPDHLPTHRTLTLLYQEMSKPGLAAHHRAIAQQLTARQRTP
jgi:tetratricopeptide (TPR) repeat protein